MINQQGDMLENNMREITIDIISSKGISLIRYESSSSPKVGETISTLRPEKKSFKVISVDHLIAEPVEFRLYV